MRIGIVGATGLVGRTVMKILEEGNIPLSEIALFASDRETGQRLSFHKELLSVEIFDVKKLHSNFDFLFFCTNSEISRVFAPLTIEKSRIVIDNSSAFRRIDKIPLIIPEINGHLIKGYSGIVANPNCSTIQMLKALYPIYKEYGLREVFVSTYQAVSGAGLEGVLTLKEGEQGLSGKSVFLKEIHENVIPMIGFLNENGFSEEEDKLIFESRRILDDFSIQIYPTATRVPVITGHCEAIFIRTANEVNMETVKRLYSNHCGLTCTDSIITPKEVAGRNETYISRLRKVGEREIMMWVVADNLRVGAALNAVTILKFISDEVNYV